MNRTSRSPITVGSVIRVPEPDYCYGRGELTLRIDEVGAIERHDGEPWIGLRGVQLRSDGAPVGERLALVRIAALNSQPRSSAALKERQL